MFQICLQYKTHKISFSVSLEVILCGTIIAVCSVNFPWLVLSFNNNKKYLMIMLLFSVHARWHFKIIDPKKDLVKLQMGKYVSLGKVESCLKLDPAVKSICVCARSPERTAVALIFPDLVITKTGSSYFGNLFRHFVLRC